MSPEATLGAALVVYLSAAVIPGPNFVVVVDTSATSTRKNGVCVALGIASGGLILAAFSLFGISQALLGIPILSSALHVICGLYLAYIGVQLWRNAGESLKRGGAVPSLDVRRAYGRGLFNILTNPKAFIFFGTVMTAVIPSGESLGLRIAVLVEIFVSSVVWHVSLALFFSNESAQRRYGRAKPILNRVLGTVLSLMGLRLAVFGS
ncbi:LysE family translocator [Streptomyces sp. NPDC020681]|uniref:LysE family translocator n=1 Tax=Streptomyces sp. NPDC020681 TaxID=3365083 RepID=UPI00378EC9EE